MGLEDAVFSLIEHSELDSLKRIVPAGFNWCKPDPQYKVLYIQFAAAHAVTTNTNTFKKYLETLSWLMECGADPLQRAGNTCGYKMAYSRADKEIIVPCKEESTITFLLTARSKFEEHSKSAWATELGQVASLLAVLTKSHSGQADRVNVSSGVVDLWEAIYRDSSTHDVSLQTAHGAVTAHRLVLAKASPVLSAMLSSGMREGAQQSIDVKDAGKDGVTFFMELLYCGASSSDVDCSSALTALDLAHRWQILAVVAMVERAIPEMVTDDTFASVAEAACLKNLSDLKASCQAFASKSKAVQDKLKKGQLPEPVLALLGTPAQASQQQKKRRRTF